MYEEQYFLDLLVSMANGYLSFRYSEYFLKHIRESRKLSIYLWIVIYSIGQLLFSYICDIYAIQDRFIQIVMYALLILFLQKAFFEENRLRQIFVIASFIAGWDILRFLASPMAHAIFNAWSPLWIRLVESFVEFNNFSMETITNGMLIVNRIVVFVVLAICRGVQLGLFSLYLKLITKNFTVENHELNIQESLFLTFPCITVIFIDLTMRLMAYSVDNSAMMLIYERVPSTLILLPLVSLLLLGIVISSVILFHNLVRYKDEEQRRLLLENRVMNIHHEVEELNDIYADIRGLRHDLRGHINNIAAYVREIAPKNCNELETYIEGMENTVSRLDFADSTGNPISDIIIHQSRQRANRSNIKFNVDFHYPKTGGFDVYDLSIILNNALQNAFEACEKIETDSKNISIRSYTKGSLFFVEVENNFNGELKPIANSNIFATTKEKSRLHGVGLVNIKRCAQKYNGDLDIQVTDIKGSKIFCLTVMLYGKNLKND